MIRGGNAGAFPLFDSCFYYHPSESSRLSWLQECAQLGRRLEPWDRLQFLEGGCEGVGKAPHGARLELLVLGVEVKGVDHSREMPRSSQLALDEGAVNDQFGRRGCELLLTPGFHLTAHRLEIPLHSIHSDREAVLK